jgi:hypothetical protein
MAKEYYAHSLPGRQKCEKFKQFKRLERSFMEECGGNGKGVCGGIWVGRIGISGGVVTGV